MYWILQMAMKRVTFSMILEKHKEKKDYKIFYI